MQDQEINDFAARLEAEILYKDALAKFECLSESDYKLVATRAGYLLLAASLLRAAISDQEDIDSAAYDASKILSQDSQVRLHTFERDGDLLTIDDAVSETRDKTDWWFVGCAVLAALCIMVFIVGIFSVIDWLWSLV